VEKTGVFLAGMLCSVTQCRGGQQTRVALMTYTHRIVGWSKKQGGVVEIILNLALTFSTVAVVMLLLESLLGISSNSWIGDEYSISGGIFVILSGIFWFIYLIMRIWL